jgi:Right handed beta helix region
MPPTGATTIPAGNDSDMTPSYVLAPNTTYWLAPGVHTVGTGEYSQFQPDDGDIFIGAPGAVVDGQGLNQFAFTDNPAGASNVTIEYLTIENFTSGEGEGVVNQAGQPGWVVEHNTIGPNQFTGSNPGGAGVMLGSDNVDEYNCLTENGEYGFSSFGGSSNITLEFNEISYNDGLGGYDQSSSPIQCGCSGGGKFWVSENVTVKGNYVHNNGNVGLWVDTDNTGFLIADNYIADNYAEGIIYEISYNAIIENNTFIGNAVDSGPGLGGFPDSALYISESGFDDRVANPFHATTFLVTENVFLDNWGGVVIWENANRYCSDGSDQVCTLVDPAIFTLASCAAHLAERSPIDYYDNCRWRAQNVTVSHDVFSYTPSAIGGECTVANYCGENGLFSNYGESPYSGAAVPTNITFLQDNHFRSNVYSGPWRFEAWSQGNLDNPVNSTVWRANVTDECGTAGEISSGTCDSGFAQDQDSMFNASLGPVIVSFDANPSTVVLRGSTTLATNESGGIGAITYVYTGLPAGCASANTATLVCTPALTGVYNVTVYVNDSAGHSAYAVAALTVLPVYPAPFPAGELWLLGVGLIVVAVAVGMAVVVFRRRNSRQEQVDSTPTEGKNR